MATLHQKSKYIQRIIKGKTIQKLVTKHGQHTLQFTDGTCIHFYPYEETARRRCGCPTTKLFIVATGHDADGDVIPATGDE